MKHIKINNHNIKQTTLLTLARLVGQPLFLLIVALLSL